MQKLYEDEFGDALKDKVKNITHESLVSALSSRPALLAETIGVLEVISISLGFPGVGSALGVIIGTIWPEGKRRKYE